MSEMEKLKAETQKQYAIQRMEDVGAYLDELIEKTHEKFKWSVRCDMLDLFCFVGYWVIMTTALFMDTPDEFRRGALDWAFLVMLVSIFRSWNATKEWRETEGEWTGATEVLRRLGMLNDKPEGGQRKRKVEKHPFAGLTESWSRTKKKMQDALYPAPAV